MNPAPNIQEDPRAPKATQAEIEAGQAALSEMTREEVGQAVEGVKSDELKLDEAFEAAQLSDLVQNVDDYRHGLGLIRELVLTETPEEHQVKLAELSEGDKELMKQCMELSTPKEDPIEEKFREKKLRELMIASYQKDIFEGEPTEEIRKAQEVYDAEKAKKEKTA